VLAAQKLGWKQIKVGIATGWTESQKKAYRIADNQIAFTDLPFVKTYKPFSIDSSGWEQSAKYGGVRLYMGNGQFEYFKRWDIGKGAPSERIQARLRMIGIEPSSLAKEGAWRKRGRESRETNRRSMIMACRDIELNLGTKYFLAVDSGYVGELIGSLEMLRQRGLF
jgi:hypothetical protein